MYTFINNYLFSYTLQKKYIFNYEIKIPKLNFNIGKQFLLKFKPKTQVCV